MPSLPTLGAFAIVLLASRAGCWTAGGGGECGTGKRSVAVVTLNLYHDRDD